MKALVLISSFLLISLLSFGQEKKPQPVAAPADTVVMKQELWQLEEMAKLKDQQVVLEQKVTFLILGVLAQNGYDREKLKNSRVAYNKKGELILITEKPK